MKSYNFIEIKQFTKKKILACSLPFLEVINNVRFTHRLKNLSDPLFSKLESKEEFQHNEYYQRLTSDDRTKKIKGYLVREIAKFTNENYSSLGSFPTSLIIASDLYEDSDDLAVFEEFIRSNNDAFGPIFLSSSANKIIFPNTNSSLIVDGQHRLAGMKLLYDEAKKGEVKLGKYPVRLLYDNLTSKKIIESLESFHFLCTILINFDVWEQGKVFVDVNFNQKPVNKSIYYDIFGSYPETDKNDIFIAHNLALHLNNYSNSVLKNKFRMLGNGEGLFSQAFFVESILPFFKEDNIWNNLLYDFFIDKRKIMLLPKFFRAYFTAIKKVFSIYWPTEEENTSRKYSNILLKTTGLGALIAMINPIYKYLENKNIDFYEIDEEHLVRIFSKIFNLINKNSELYFSGSKGAYSKGGGKGLQNKLYDDIYKDLFGRINEREEKGINVIE